MVKEQANMLQFCYYFVYVYFLCIRVESNVASEFLQERVFMLIFIHCVLFLSYSGVQIVGILGIQNHRAAWR